MTTPQKLKCRVESVLPHGEHVYTLELIPASPPIPRFKAGQFFHLALDPYDPSGFWPESRVFSIASSPRERHHVHFTYSVRGQYTARMERELREGGEVWIKMPYGHFLQNIGGPTLLFAGGTGITAFTAFMRELGATAARPVTLFYGARRRELLIYRPLVEECFTSVAGFKAFYFLEELQAETENELRGQIAVAPVWAQIPDTAGSACYLAGPPAMLKSLTDQLQNAGVEPAKIYTDAWE